MRSAGWLLAACCGALLGLDQNSSPGAAASQSQPQQLSADATPEQQARASCVGCHAFPPADILPKHAWRDEVVKMLFIREKRLPPLGAMASVSKTVTLPPDLERALTYYAGAAPERLPAPDGWPPVSESPLRFSSRSVSMGDMPVPRRCRTSRW